MCADDAGHDFRTTGKPRFAPARSGYYRRGDDILSRQPNIILINCDDLGYGDVGCYGSRNNDTPAIDRLASEGIRFTDFYMAASLCSPSRCGMLTGCYPKRIGCATFDGKMVLFPGDAVGLNPSEVTIANLLKDRGYATSLIGKWHVGDQPEFLPHNFGFDEYYGLPYSNDMGIMDERPDYPPLPLIDGVDVIEEQPDQSSITERYVERSIDFIRRNRERPFFLYLAHMYVHNPLYVQERFMRDSRNGRYGAAVASIDWSVDCIMYELKRFGLDENTLVIFTSDNGGSHRDGVSNGPLRGTKKSRWEGGFRVPFIARWPGRISGGVESGEIAASLDLLPTFAHLAGAEPPDDRIIDGNNITSLLFNEPDAASEHESFYYYMGEELACIRSGKWKLHLQTGELYNLHLDVGETTDVAKENPDIINDLESKAESARRDLGDSARSIEGENTRPIGRVKNPKPLTSQDVHSPYAMAEYDIEIDNEKWPMEWHAARTK